MLHGLCFGEEAGARNLVFFRVKWLQPAMKGTSCVRRNIGLGYFKYGLCAGCFEALTIVCTEQDDTLAEQHAAAMLLSANTEQVQNVVCRKHMQLGSAMSLRIVRTSFLICFVKCHDGQPGFQRDKLSSLSCQCGPKSCQKPRRPSVAQRKKQLSSLDCVNLLDR